MGMNLHALTDDQVARICALVRSHNPRGLDDGDAATLSYGGTTIVEWEGPSRYLTVDLIVRHDRREKKHEVSVKCPSFEGTPDALLKIGNLLVRITALADAVQAITDETKTVDLRAYERAGGAPL
jgi:hypothetical protein